MRHLHVKKRALPLAALVDFSHVAGTHFYISIIRRIKGELDFNQKNKKAPGPETRERSRQEQALFTNT
jgi:hypothetical protein